jgi:hypothetical protein
MASIGDVTRPAFAYDEATDTWVPVGIGPHTHTASSVGAVATSSFAAKGDLLVGTGAGTLVAQTVGANGTVLTADSAEADGVKWAAPSASTKTWSLLNTGGTALTGALTVTVSGISNVSEILVVVDSASSVNASANFRVRPNNDTGANYIAAGVNNQYASSYSPSNFNRTLDLAANAIFTGTMGNTAGSTVTASIYLENTNGTSWVPFACMSAGADTDARQNFTQGLWKGTAAITSISITSSSGNLDGGTIYVYGAS